MSVQRVDTDRVLGPKHSKCVVSRARYEPGTSNLQTTDGLEVSSHTTSQTQSEFLSIASQAVVTPYAGPGDGAGLLGPGDDLLDQETISWYSK